MENTDSCPLCHNKLDDDGKKKLLVLLLKGDFDPGNLDEKKKLHHESMKTGKCVICGGDIFAMFLKFKKDESSP